MGQTYNYSYDNVIDLINNNTSIRAVSEVLEKFGKGVVEMSRNFQGSVAGVGIDKIYNAMRDDIQEAYDALKNIDGVFEIVLNEAKNNKRIAEEPDPEPVMPANVQYSGYGTSAAHVQAPAYRPTSNYSSNASR